MKIIKKLDPFILLSVIFLVILLYGCSEQACYVMLAVTTCVLYGSGLLARLFASEIAVKSWLRTWLVRLGFPVLFCLFFTIGQVISSWWQVGQDVSLMTLTVSIASMLYLAFVGIVLHRITPVQSFLMNGTIVHSLNPFWYEPSKTRIEPLPKEVTTHVSWIRDLAAGPSNVFLDFAIIPVKRVIYPNTYQHGTEFTIEEEQRKLTEEVLDIMDAAVHTDDVWTNALERFKKAGIYAYDPEVLGGEVDLSHYDIP